MVLAEFALPSVDSGVEFARIRAKAFAFTRFQAVRSAYRCYRGQYPHKHTSTHQIANASPHEPSHLMLNIRITHTHYLLYTASFFSFSLEDIVVSSHSMRLAMHACNRTNFSGKDKLRTTYANHHPSTCLFPRMTRNLCEMFS
jgi:hypothetical protein